MPVKGMEDQNPQNPNCCPDLIVYEGGAYQPAPEALRTMRHGLQRAGLTHRSAGERLGLGLSSIRQRLYGRHPFTRTEFVQLCRLSGIDPDALQGASVSPATERWWGECAEEETP
jgi:hypothetical protein